MNPKVIYKYIKSMLLFLDVSNNNPFIQQISINICQNRSP